MRLIFNRLQDEKNKTHKEKKYLPLVQVLTLKISLIILKMTPKMS